MGVVGKREKSFGDENYTTYILPASEALDVAPELLSMLGADAFVEFVTASEEERNALIHDPDVTGPAVKKILKAMTEGKGPSVAIKRLLQKTRCDKCRIGDTSVAGVFSDERTFDTHFAGRLPLLGQVVWWVAQVNFLGL